MLTLRSIHVAKRVAPDEDVLLCDCTPTMLCSSCALPTTDRRLLSPRLR